MSARVTPSRGEDGGGGGGVHLYSAPVRALIAGLLLCLAPACSHTEWRAQFGPTTGFTGGGQPGSFLKVHMVEGDLYVFDSWRVDPTVLHGRGRHLDELRSHVETGEFHVPLEQIALLETNEPHTVTNAGPIVLGIVTGASLIVSAVCLTTPKACFGSCPTFYTDDGSGPTLQAEGFSQSIARAFEATDVDTLEGARPRDGSLSVVMRNEALETHMVRHVNLLAAPRGEGRRVLRGGDRFFPTREILPPTACSTDAEDCLSLVSALDGQEHTTPTDGEDLAARQTIELVLPEASGDAGLVIAGRNSLVSTFLFYQMLAYLGRSAGEWLMALERSEAPLEGGAELAWQLARIDVEMRDADGAWQPVGHYEEVGPIARDRQVIPLPTDRPTGPIHVRLELTRGFWKLDELALALLDEPVPVVRIRPRAVRRRGDDDRRALRVLRDPQAQLVTYPGDAYTLIFDVPEGDHELFLESRGYYYEWMRAQWLEEENPRQAARFFFDTASVLRQLAPEYKRIEPEVERIFWQSRIGEAP